MFAQHGALLHGIGHLSHSDRAAGATIAYELLQQGVIVRPLDWMGMPAGVRVTVGTPEENDKLLAALKQVLRAGA